MKTIELVINEDIDCAGTDAISLVERPAIEENFVYLSENLKQTFAEVDKERRIVMGAFLVPDKLIYRKDDKNGEYNIFFSKATIRQCMELFFRNGNQNNHTLEHKKELTGLTVVESWEVEDLEKDKTALYNLSLPVGTWAGCIKVNNDDIWENYVKTGKVKGFSIEGYFADKLQSQLANQDQEEQAEKVIKQIIDILTNA